MCSFLIYCAALVAAPGDDAKNAADLKGLQGNWAAVSAVDPMGQSAPKEFIDTFKLVIKDDTIQMKAGVGGASGEKSPLFRVKLDAAASPKALNLTGIENVPTEGTMLGTYALDGDSLKICFPTKPGDPRPKSVSASTEEKCGLFTFKRVKE